MFQVDENAPFQTKLDGKQIQVFVGPFSSFSYHVLRHKANVLGFWDIADFRDSGQFCGPIFLSYLGQNLQ